MPLKIRKKKVKKLSPNKKAQTLKVKDSTPKKEAEFGKDNGELFNEYLTVLNSFSEGASRTKMKILREPEAKSSTATDHMIEQRDVSPVKERSNEGDEDSLKYKRGELSNSNSLSNHVI
jgi:hypothetical protein